MHWRIETMVAQLGGRGMSGAFLYTGASQMGYKAREDDATPRDSGVEKHGLISYEIGIQFKVNSTKRWKIIVTLESNDTYTIRLWHPFRRDKFIRTGIVGEVLDKATDVYCDQLQSIVESIYDQAIEKYCNGCIPL